MNKINFLNVSVFNFHFISNSTMSKYLHYDMHNNDCINIAFKYKIISYWIKYSHNFVLTTKQIKKHLQQNDISFDESMRSDSLVKGNEFT